MEKIPHDSQEAKIHFDLYHEFFSSLAKFPEEEWEYYKSQHDVLSFSKGEYFIRLGDHSSMFGFVSKGLFKQYITTIEGQNYIHSFPHQGKMISDTASLIRHQKSQTDILALEDSVVLASRKAKDREYCAYNGPWERISRKLSEIRFLEKWDREQAFLTMTASQRYEDFAKNNPEIFSRLSQVDIAAYLGVTSVSLSRIVRGIKQSKN